MIGSLVKKIIGSKNERVLRGFQPMVHTINEQEAGMRALPDDDLRGKTVQFRERLGRGGGGGGP